MSAVSGDSFLLDTDEAWPIRDQLGRHTCVAFSVVACVEFLTRIQRGMMSRLSPQFVYWAAKHEDSPLHPDHGCDRTTARHLCDAMHKWGVCEESLCPYNGTSVAGNPGHNNYPQIPMPSNQALTSAAASSRSGLRGYYQAFSSGRGRAQLLYDQISRGVPVVMSLPVFPVVQADFDEYTDTNWTSEPSINYGIVQDFVPGQTGKACAFHSVCVVGYVRDPSQEGGGAFIFRNSWGSQFGVLLPNRELSHAPLPGYGQCSAQYVDMFLNEMWRPG